jgi:hypothetical protein
MKAQNKNTTEILQRVRQQVIDEHKPDKIVWRSSIIYWDEWNGVLLQKSNKKRWDISLLRLTPDIWFKNMGLEPLNFYEHSTAMDALFSRIRQDGSKILFKANVGDELSHVCTWSADKRMGKLIPAPEIFRRMLVDTVVADDKESLWQYAWMGLLTGFSEEVLEQHTSQDTVLHNMFSSKEYSQCMSILGQLKDNMANAMAGNHIRIHAELFRDLSDSLDLVKSHLRMSGTSACVYSFAHIFGVTELKLLTPFSKSGKAGKNFAWFGVHSDTGFAMYKNWPSLVAFFNSIGFSEPMPFGLKFCEENLPSLNSLTKTVKQIYSDPAAWNASEVLGESADPQPSPNPEALTAQLA